MKIFVISLKDSKRRSFIKKSLEKLDITFEFFDAINGKKLSKKDKDKYCSSEALKRSPKWLNDGMIGCALSHYFIYKLIISQNIEKAIIIEDDMLIDKRFLKILNYLSSKELKEEVIMLYYRAFNRITFSTQEHECIDSTFNVYKPLTLEDIPITTGCYYLTKMACAELKKIILPIRVGPDSWKYFVLNSNFHDLKVIYPRAMTDAGFQSEINYIEASSKSVFLFKRIIDWLDFPLLNYLTKLRRKHLEKNMSKFALSDEQSKVQNEKMHLVQNKRQ